MQRMPLAGITFMDTFFVKQGRESETLCFHELVHVVQWERLGVDNFLLTYGLGFIQAGYENSPLEKMACSLQNLFEEGTLPDYLVPAIQRMTDEIWAQTAPMVQRHR
jgi:hypothetical protein